MLQTQDYYYRTSEATKTGQVCVRERLSNNEAAFPGPLLLFVAGSARRRMNRAFVLLTPKDLVWPSFLPDLRPDNLEWRSLSCKRWPRLAVLQVAGEQNPAANIGSPAARLCAGAY